MWKHKNFINLQLCASETWLLNETPSTATPTGATISTNINFVSNGVNYTLIEVGKKERIYYDSTVVFDEMDNTWADVAYRTLTFATAPTGDLLTWLQANGTKQSAPQPTLTFKHFFDAGTIGTGAVKFRHYSQTEPSAAAPKV